MTVAYSGTNCSTVINNCIDDVTSTQGTVEIGDGVFHLTGSIMMKANVALIGQGKSTYFELDFDGVAIDTSSSVTNTDMYIGHIRIDGNRATRAAGTGIR